jgi:hypothetical protein
MLGQGESNPASIWQKADSFEEGTAKDRAPSRLNTPLDTIDTDTSSAQMQETEIPVKTQALSAEETTSQGQALTPLQFTKAVKPPSKGAVVRAEVAIETVTPVEVHRENDQDVANRDMLTQRVELED